MRRRAFLSSAIAAAVAARAAGRVRVGCQTRAYGSPLPDRAEFLRVLEDLAEAGYEGFETNFRSLEHSFDEPAAMRREIEARGVALIGLHVGAGLFDPEKIPEERALIERVARGSHELGGGHVIVSGRRLPESADGRPKREALLIKARELERAGKRCAEMGVRLSFHNHAHEVQHDAAEIRTVLSETDPEAVSLLFDVGHVLHNELDPAAFIRELHARIAGLHLRDVRDGDETLIGTGTIDFEALGEAIKAVDWDGWAIVEVNRREDISSNELVTRARRHLQRTMGV